MKLQATLDASALLAYLQQEPGYEMVRKALREGGAAISAVNLAEVQAKLEAKGKDAKEITLRLKALGLRVFPFTEEDALLTAELYPPTRSKGLSLGDRACLALARRLGLVALTADTAWSTLKLGVKVRLIR